MFQQSIACLPEVSQDGQQDEEKDHRQEPHCAKQQDRKPLVEITPVRDSRIMKGSTGKKLKRAGARSFARMVCIVLPFGQHFVQKIHCKA
jgi:hypothetical protein